MFDPWRASRDPLETSWTHCCSSFHHFQPSRRSRLHAVSPKVDLIAITILLNPRRASKRPSGTQICHVQHFRTETIISTRNRPGDHSREASTLSCIFQKRAVILNDMVKHESCGFNKFCCYGALLEVIQMSVQLHGVLSSTHTFSVRMCFCTTLQCTSAPAVGFQIRASLDKKYLCVPQSSRATG